MALGSAPLTSGRDTSALRCANTATMIIILMRALPTASTGRSGSQAASSSALAPGIAASAAVDLWVAVGS